jgi:hypothetical protein
LTGTAGLLTVAGTVHGAAELVSDQGWVAGNILTGGWLSNNFGAAQAAGVRNTARSEALLNLPRQAATSALRVATGNWHGMDPLNSNQINALDARGDRLGAKVLAGQTALNIAGLAAGGVGFARVGVAMPPRTLATRTQMTGAGAGAAAELAGFEVHGLKAERILEGTNGKVAVIGRAMGNPEIKGVRDYAEALRARGHNVEIFDGQAISEGAQSQFERLTAGGRRLTNQELVQTKIFQENKAWAASLRQQGYTVVDLGYTNPGKQGFSPFYTMEKRTIFSSGAHQ